MKLISTEFKKVKYFGHDIVVHNDVKFLATDNDGRVFAFSDKPVLYIFRSWWLQDSDSPDCIADHIATYDLGSVLPADTLVEVE